MKTINISSPIDAEIIAKLTVGTQVLISGVIYTARDMAHRRLIQALDKGHPPPRRGRLSAPLDRPPAAAWTSIPHACSPPGSGP